MSKDQSAELQRTTAEFFLLIQKSDQAVTEVKDSFACNREYRLLSDLKTAAFVFPYLLREIKALHEFYCKIIADIEAERAKPTKETQ